MIARIDTLYRDEVAPALVEQFKLGNKHMVPRLEKIVINMGVGVAIADSKLLDAAVTDLMLITGQRPVVCQAKKAVSNFRLREGYGIGCKVTLRGRRMYEFFDRFVTVAVPRIRDFRGLNPASFDGRGNYTLGIREQIIFPEIDYNKVDRIYGMNVTLVTSASTDEEGQALLAELGMPFRK